MKFNWNGQELYIDGYLANALNTIAYNIKKDWDFVIFISGDRMTRVGKSVLAQVVGAYLGYCMQKMKLNDNAFNIDHIFLEGKKMMEYAFNAPKYSVLVFDEGRESLAKSKMSGFTQDLIDFFTECGQLNHCFVICCPDWFDLKEEVTVAKSEVLINVYRKRQNVTRDIFKTGEKVPVTIFERGYFEFFSRKKKALLYDKFRTTRRKNYGMVKADFTGRFTHQYPVDEELYRAKKKDSLARFNERKKKEKDSRESLAMKKAKIALNGMIKEFSVTKKDFESIATRLELPKTYFNNLIYKQKDEIKEKIENEKERAMKEEKKKEQINVSFDGGEANEANA